MNVFFLTFDLLLLFNASLLDLSFLNGSVCHAEVRKTMKRQFTEAT